ncbi:MAG: class I SAM-dependent methyltransferase, partial [Acidobacteriota bacterium]
MGALAAMVPWRMARKIRNNQERLDRVERRLDGVEGRLGDVVNDISGRQDLLESTLRTIQDLLESINSVRLAAVDQRGDQLEAGLRESAEEVTRLRDGLMPAAEGRWNALFERLAFELEETASLVERNLASEPLPVIEPGPSERALAQALTKVQPLLVEAFRGSEAEIGHRMESVLPLLEGHVPVLDLGCGRGELLLLLREAGIEARGVEGDVALVQGAVRRGLEVDHADVLDALRALDEASVGAVTAFHLFEHFSGTQLSEVLDQCRRVLRPEGILVAECPNPHNIRVGASLFWQDPTHVRPLLPETLGVFLKASGFSVRNLEYLHPFPEEQFLRAGNGPTVDPAVDGRID